MELIKKSEFAKRLGVSKARVSKLVTGILKDAVIDGKINLDAACVADYAKSRHRDVSNPDKEITGSDTGGDNLKNVPANAEVSAFEKMTLSELCEIWGTDERFKAWLMGRKIITEIKAKELKLAEDKGLLVAREMVKIGIIEPINTAHIKLMTDGAKTISLRVVTMLGADSSVQEIEEFVIDQISSFIKPLKAKIARTLNNA